MAARALVVAVLAMAGVLLVMPLALGGWGGMSTDLLDLVPLVLFPLTTAALSALGHRMTRSKARWGMPERRWMFAGLVTAAGLLAVPVVAVVVGALVAVVDGPPAGGTGGGGLVDLLLVAVVGPLFLGLPVWLLLWGSVVGPGGRCRHLPD